MPSETKKPTKKPAKRKQVKQQPAQKPLSRRDITLKNIREHDVKRGQIILRLIPKFIKFYKTISPAQASALKYYKGFGSYFESYLLAGPGSGEKDGPREILFPFHKFEDISFHRDIMGMNNQNATYSLELPSGENIDNYINQSYEKRIQVLNNLDTVYDRADCPKLTGEEILFRGMSNLGPAITNLKPGDTYTFKNFISTTFDRKVAERFSMGECVFVLTGLKDIPFIYTPNSKQFDNLEKTINSVRLKSDISEATLPRNLEFEITAVEHRNIMIRFSQESKIGNLLKTLKKRGITSDSDIIEDSMFPKGLFIFAKLKTWLPREPIKFENIMKNAKFVLDEQALKSWSGKIEDDF
jgi:hypothetical protein